MEDQERIERLKRTIAETRDDVFNVSEAIQKATDEYWARQDRQTRNARILVVAIIVCLVLLGYLIK